MIKFIVANQVNRNSVILDTENENTLLKVNSLSHSKTGKHGAGKIVFICCDFLTESKNITRKYSSTDFVKVPDLSEFSCQGIVTNIFYENINSVWDKFRAQEKDTNIELNLDSLKSSKPILLEVSFVQNNNYELAYLLIYKTQLGDKYPDIPLIIEAWSSYTLNIINSPYGRKIISIQ